MSDLQELLARACDVAAMIARAGAWTAAGLALIHWRRAEHRRDWRWLLWFPVLMATVVLAHVRPSLQTTDLIPTPREVVGPMLIAGTAVVWLRRRVLPGLDPQPEATRMWLWAAIGVAVLLAAPMILSPVVERWNVSGWMDSRSYDTSAHNILSGKVPAGDSQYMPVYQFGLAAVYAVFGHFFFAQQLVNVALALLTVVLLCLSSWNLFRNVWAVLLIGVWAAFSRQFVYAIAVTQIETWYTPIVAFTIFAWTCYWRTPSRPHLLLLAGAAALAINTRNQGAFYFGWLCLSPLLIAAIPWPRRVADAALATVIVVMSLVPWSVRNYVVEGRLSPMASRNAYYLAIINDPRLSFYGLRYWEGWDEVYAEYERTYPDPAERNRVMSRVGLTAPFRNPEWFARAVVWRAVAFYGLLPDGMLSLDKPRPTNWAVEWRGYLYWRLVPLMLLPLSLIAFASRPGPVTGFLVLAIATNLVAVMMTGSPEDRVSYPVLPMHLLLVVAAVFVPQNQEPGWSILRSISSTARRRTWMLAGFAVTAVLIGVRVQSGRSNLYAPQSERDVVISPPVQIDQSLPSLNDVALRSSPPLPLDREWDGRRVRVRLITFNYHWPPKWGGRISYMPDFSTDPNRETYYQAALVLPPGNNRITVGVSWVGAAISEPLREGDEVEVEGRTIFATDSPLATYWLQIDKARKVSPRSIEIPAFY